MIVVSGRATQESALHYMESMLNLYQNAFPALPIPLNPLDLLRFPQPESARAANRVEQRAADAVEASEAALKRRIAELEAKIPKRPKKKAAETRTKSRRKS